MRRILKLTPLLGSVIALSACSALGLNANAKPQAATQASNTAAYGQYAAKAATAQTATAKNGYVKLASNDQSSLVSDYLNSGWYTQKMNPYAGGQVTLETNAPLGGLSENGFVDIPDLSKGSSEAIKTAHNGYHDAYGNPVPAPTSAPMHRTVKAPALRGSYGPSYYGNLGGIMHDVDSELYGVVGRLGVQKSWYGAEVEGTVGISDEDETITVALPNGAGPVPVEVSAGVDYSLAGFAVGRVPLGSKFKALGRVGYHSTQIGVSASSTALGNGQMVTESESESFDGLAYGAGLEYDFDAVNGVRLDYTRYDLGDDAVMDSLAATYLRRF